MEKPKVSVIMSVYNGEAYLKEAMDSILAQTYENWECIVINDCSSDNTAPILEGYKIKDKRVQVFHNEKNLRLPASLNRALKLASGKYIVRMDGDDLCRSDRLERQVAFMEEHPELSIVSCRYFGLKGDKAFPASMQRSGTAARTKALFLFFNPILHPGVIARREIFAEKGYDEAYSCTEDLELWIRLLQEGKNIAVQDDYLMLYRLHKNQVTATSGERQREQYKGIINSFYRKFLFPPNNDEVEFLMNGIYYREELDEKRYFQFIRKVQKFADEKGSFRKADVDYAAFETVMAYRTEFALGKKEFLRMLSRFPILFILKEFLRRKQAARKAKKDYEKAAELFGFLPYDLTKPVPVYKRQLIQ